MAGNVQFARDNYIIAIDVIELVIGTMDPPSTTHQVGLVFCLRFDIIMRARDIYVHGCSFRHPWAQILRRQRKPDHDRYGKHYGLMVTSALPVLKV